MSKFVIDVRQIESLAESLVQLSGERLGGAALKGVNEVAGRFEESAIQGELANIALRKAYVKSKTDLKLGTDFSSPSATITTQRALTPLGNFAGLVYFRQPGAPRRAGPVKGRRSAGAAVNIKNTDRVQEGQWFVLPLKAGKISGGNGYGAFVRASALLGKGKNDHGSGLGDAGRRRDGRYGKQQIYGPSPGALFARQIDTQGTALQDDLQKTVVANVLVEFNERFK